MDKHVPETKIYLYIMYLREYLKQTMKVCVIGTGALAERNVQLFKTRHSVSLFVPFQITPEDSLELTVRCNPIPIYYNPTSLTTVDLFIISVELIQNNVNGEIDLDPILQISQIIRQFAHTGATVIVESKVGVGITRKYFSDLHVHCSYSPSCFKPDDTGNEIVTKLIGGLDNESEVLATQFYQTIYSNVIRTGSAEIAEAAAMLKAAQETVQEAMINEFADFCDTIKLDIHKVIDATSVAYRDDPRVKLPWVGRRYDTDSKLLMMNTGQSWPILCAASDHLTNKPAQIYKRIVDIYCLGDYDRLHKMAFLVVGLGTVVGSVHTKDSPVIDIIKHLELEGATVVKYDMFVEKYSKLPELTYNTGKSKFDGILVMHPYMMSMWEGKKETTFFCRH